tara:strand:- start:24 stop:881 length:858 start_codon:yes stop_codon:yes gene_type:complete
MYDLCRDDNANTLGVTVWKCGEEGGETFGPLSRQGATARCVAPPVAAARSVRLGYAPSYDLELRAESDLHYTYYQVEIGSAVPRSVPIGANATTVTVHGNNFWPYALNEGAGYVADDAIEGVEGEVESGAPVCVYGDGGAGVPPRVVVPGRLRGCTDRIADWSPSRTALMDGGGGGDGGDGGEDGRGDGGEDGGEDTVGNLSYTSRSGCARIECPSPTYSDVYNMTFYVALNGREDSLEVRPLPFPLRPPFPYETVPVTHPSRALSYLPVRNRPRTLPSFIQRLP